MTKYWIGKQRSEETKEKIRKSLFGRKQGKRTVETKIKISNALKGVKRRPLSQEHKNKISESKLDWKPDGEHLSQEWQLQNGYEVGYRTDIKPVA